jgi:hypothetical protein
VYTGQFDLGVEHGLAYSVVWARLQCWNTLILHWGLLGSGQILYTDNLYRSPVQLQDLYDQGIYASGTCWMCGCRGVC